MSCDDIVVWQWLTDDGQWHSYSPLLSNHIEFQRRQNIYQVYLGETYFADLSQMAQVNTATGFLRPMRRVFLSHTSCLSRGVTWEWSNDSATGWHPYSSKVSDFLEQQYTSQVPLVDLSRSGLGLPYVIDFVRMIQIRKETGTQRPINRGLLPQLYCKAGNRVGSSGRNAEYAVSSTTTDGAGVSTETRYQHGAVAPGRNLMGGANASQPCSSNSSNEAESTVDQLRLECEQLKDKMLCKICLDRECEVIYLPCSHIVSCKDCSKEVKECPLCREKIKHKKNFYLG